MGIKDLNTFLKTYSPDAFRLVPIKSFSRRRIAVDATLLLFQSFSAAFTGIIKTEVSDADILKDKIFSRKKDSNNNDSEYVCPNYKKVLYYVFNRISGFVWELYYHGITPVFVRDGDAVHEKNEFARERRKASRLAMAERIKALRQQIEDTPILERRNNTDIVSLRKLLAQSPPVKPFKDFEQVFSYIANDLGAPVIKAPNEAEKFCAFLAANGIAAASYTTDTDSYAFGAPIVISSIDQDSKNENYMHLSQKTAAENEETGNSVFINRKQCSVYFQTVVTPIILDRLKLTHLQFVDLCIMLGCDFNSRVSGIGPAKTWKLIQQHILSTDYNNNSNRLIEKIAVDNSKYDWSVLCPERCREIFTQMTDCEETYKLLTVNDFNIDESKLKDHDVKSCYYKYFVPLMGSKSRKPESVNYII